MKMIEIDVYLFWMWAVFTGILAGILIGFSLTDRIKIDE
tara:strand:- start:1044 stop:1160 length:117 start_codon:yes stop_codon:yes gene_type:complete